LQPLSAPEPRKIQLPIQRSAASEGPDLLALSISAFRSLVLPSKTVALFAASKFVLPPAIRAKQRSLSPSTEHTRPDIKKKIQGARIYPGRTLEKKKEKKRKKKKNRVRIQGMTMA
jgi:hypothetical protein